MEIEKRVTVKITEKEIAEMIAHYKIELFDDEDYELVSAFSSLGEYTYNIVKKDNAVISEM